MLLQIRCTLVLSSSSRSLASEPFAISVDYKLFLFESSDECVSLYHVLFYRNVNGHFFYQKDSLEASKVAAPECASSADAS